MTLLYLISADSFIPDFESKIKRKFCHLNFLTAFVLVFLIFRTGEVLGRHSQQTISLHDSKFNTCTVMDIRLHTVTK